MKIAVLSGKGGAGKTLVAVNLARAAARLGRAVYIDCDVEEPNGCLFLKPSQVNGTPVTTPVPVFDDSLCRGCRKCVSFCRFHALAYLRGKHKVFPQVCHGCSGCALVCPTGAARMGERPVGRVESGLAGGVETVTGILDLGEASAVPVIRAALAAAPETEGLTVIDGPPGSSCSVMESVAPADLCLLVAEPTAFGLHNVQMVHELLTLLKKPCMLVFNKQEAPYEPLEAFARERALPVAARLPFRSDYAGMCARGELLYEKDGQARAIFDGLLKVIGGEACETAADPQR